MCKSVSSSYQSASWPWLFQVMLSSASLSWASMSLSWPWTRGRSTSSTECTTCSQTVGESDRVWFSAPIKILQKFHFNITSVNVTKGHTGPEQQDRMSSSLKSLYHSMSPWLTKPELLTTWSSKVLYFSFVIISLRGLLHVVRLCESRPPWDWVNYISDCFNIVLCIIIKLSFCHHAHLPLQPITELSVW